MYMCVKENLILEDNIISQVLIFAFSLSAQIERNLISERTKMGIERVRNEGKHIGRAKGRLSSKYKLDEYKKYIKINLNKKSLNSIAKELNVSWVTLKKYCIRKKLIK